MRFEVQGLCVLALLQGCVSASRHDELKKKYDDARAQLVDDRAEIRTLEQELAEHTQLASQLAAQIEAGEREIAALESQNEENAKLIAAQADEGQRLTGELAALLRDKSQLPCSRWAACSPNMGGRRFQVEGHTDDVPIRNEQFPSNWELAAARALVVVRAMMASGMQSHALSAASYGEYHPTASNETAQGRSQNRRIEIVLLPDLSSLPGYDELQRAVSQR